MRRYMELIGGVGMKEGIMFKSKKTTIFEEYDKEGKCVRKTTTVEEAENDFKLNNDPVHVYSNEEIRNALVDKFNQGQDNPATNEVTNSPDVEAVVDTTIW